MPGNAHCCILLCDCRGWGTGKGVICWFCRASTLQDGVLTPQLLQVGLLRWILQISGFVSCRPGSHALQLLLCSVVIRTGYWNWPSGCSRCSCCKCMAVPDCIAGGARCDHSSSAGAQPSAILRELGSSCSCVSRACTLVVQQRQPMQQLQAHEVPRSQQLCRMFCGERETAWEGCLLAR
jgi:hypothetical protein